MGSRGVGRVVVALPGLASSVLADGVAFLQPADAVFEAMLGGWSVQQQSRLLALGTIEKRRSTVERFAGFTNEFPWSWTVSDVEEWTASMVSEGLSHSTIRNYQQSVSVFVAYVCDGRYEWGSVCEARFGSHPSPVFHEWNTAVHSNEFEGKPANRPFSRDELQKFFDYCDDRVTHAQGLGRKGWLAAYRDAVLFKTIYAWGLRRQETTMLDVVDWSANMHAPEFGMYGALSVRYGKATKGSAPKRRSVLTTMPWAAEVVAEWVTEIRPEYVHAGAELWPTERRGRIQNATLNERFAAYRDGCGLSADLRGPHCLRHSYITHLLEDGWDHLFVQQQVGHSWGATTAVYTSVSSKFRNDVLRRALDRAFVKEEQ